MGSSRPFGNIRKLKSGRYQARNYHLGNQVPADTTFATKAEARAWLATMETEIVGGRHVDPSSGRETFGNYSRRRLVTFGPGLGTPTSHSSPTSSKNSRPSSYASRVDVTDDPPPT